MLSKEITIINQLGLHARAAAKLVSLASSFTAEVEVEKDGQRVNGKSIMGVMMLAASRDSVLTVYTEGTDELVALEAIEKLINDRFGEDQ